MAIKHLQDLHDECVAAGIHKDGKYDLGRMFNHDETPQFINYGVDGSAAGLVFAGKGDECKKALSENRECVTIDPFVNMKTGLFICHLIFSGEGLTSHMCPDAASKIEEVCPLLISSTKSGYQTADSCLDVYRLFAEELTRLNIQRPVILTTDGHSSRFSFEVLEFLELEQIWMFVGPPDTTSITQLLDQINAALHRAYRQGVDNLMKSTRVGLSLNREVFVTILANMWDKWASAESVRKAAKRVGITADALSTDFMQQEKMKASALLNDDQTVVEENDDGTTSRTFTTAVSNPPSTPIGTRANEFTISPPRSAGGTLLRKGSLAYAVGYGENARRKLEALSNRAPPNVEEMGIYRVEKRPLIKTKSVKITNEHGSMRLKDMKEKSKYIKDKKEAEVERKVSLDKGRELAVERFMKCRHTCNCGCSPCEAAGMHWCSRCKKVQKSKCGNKVCRDMRDAGTLADEMIGAAVVVVANNSEAEAEEEEGEEEGESEEEWESEEEEDFEVEECEDVATTVFHGKRAIRYRVRWVGHEARTWEPAENFLSPESKSIQKAFKAAWIAAEKPWPPPSKAQY